MKSRTDPATRISKAILTDQHVSLLCRIIDLLTDAGTIERNPETIELADKIREWIDQRVPKADSQTEV